jgi:hypothetical protein
VNARSAYRYTVIDTKSDHAKTIETELALINRGWIATLIEPFLE